MARVSLLGVLTIVGAFAAGAIALGMASNRIIGPDDGIYLAAARSLAELGQYSQSFLAVPLPQTKYPPLYAMCLAVVGLVTSFEPSAFWHLKAVNALALAALVVLGVRLVLEEGCSVAWAAACGLLLATAPALVSYVDLLASDLVFAALALGVLLMTPRTGTKRSQFIVAVLAGLAALTRAVGLALCIGVAWHSVRTFGWRRSALALVVPIALIVPWFLWRAAVFPAHVGPIDTYYLTYEPSAWQVALTRPMDAAQSVWTNIRVYPTLVPMVFGWPLVWIAVLAAPISVAGLAQLAAPRRSLLLKAGAFYAVALLGHPYPIDRYLVPVVPIALIGLTVALSRLNQRSDAALRITAWAFAALLIGTQGIWLVRYKDVVRTSLHGAFGRPLNFQWAGFSEALAWIEGRTRPSDVVASFRDSVVYAYTGRRGVRAWLHLPEAWSPHEGRALTPAEVAAIVSAEFKRLGVDYVLLSPPLEDVEGRFGEAVLRELGVGGPDFPLKFVSRDGQHRIYGVGHASEPLDRAPALSHGPRAPRKSAG